jgi:hypothetical protein
VAKYPFLSDEWIAEAKKIRDELGADAPAPPPMKMNQIITEVPFGDGTLNTHMDTSSGQLDMDLGHLDDAEVTITVDYATAKAIFVEQNQQAGMQAFMSGKIKVQGDMTKMMAMGQQAPDPSAAQVAEKIKAITE